MAKYVCAICGYVYDEAVEKIKFDELPDDWVCPLCGAEKSEFVKEESSKEEPKADKPNVEGEKTELYAVVLEERESSKKELNAAELSIMCSNLAKGCEKQYKFEEQELFGELAEYYRAESKADKGGFDAIEQLLSEDINVKYPEAFAAAKADGDRGALRALTWSEKVTKIISSIITRRKKEGIDFLKGKKIFVCEICGFVYIGDEAPEICPVCKVPKLKIHEVKGV